MTSFSLTMCLAYAQVRAKMVQAVILGDSHLESYSPHSLRCSFQGYNTNALILKHLSHDSTLSTLQNNGFVDSFSFFFPILLHLLWVASWNQSLLSGRKETSSVFLFFISLFLLFFLTKVMTVMLHFIVWQRPFKADKHTGFSQWPSWLVCIDNGCPFLTTKKEKKIVFETSGKVLPKAASFTRDTCVLVYTKCAEWIPH